MFSNKSDVYLFSFQCSVSARLPDCLSIIPKISELVKCFFLIFFKKLLYIVFLVLICFVFQFRIIYNLIFQSGLYGLFSLFMPIYCFISFLNLAFVYTFYLSYNSNEVINYGKTTNLCEDYVRYRKSD